MARRATIDHALPPSFALLQVVPALDLGGVEQASLDLARGVARAGARSLVAARGGRLEGELARAGGEFVRLPLGTKNPLAVAANGVRLARVVRRCGASLIHVRSRAPAFSAWIASRLTGAPLVATYHGAYRAGDPLKRRYNRIMTAGSVVFANSAFIARHIAAEHPRAAAKIVLVPEAVDLERFDPAAVGPERIERLARAWGLNRRRGRAAALIAARLSPSKGQALALQALARLAPEQRPLLVLAGEASRPGYRRALEAETVRLGLGDDVRFVGVCDDMPAAWAAVDLALVPSTVPESFGRVVVEAAAIGRPAIASPLGALPEAIVDGETGWLADAAAPQGWAEVLARVMALPAEALARAGAAAQARARARHSLDALCAATFAAYRAVLERRG